MVEQSAENVPLPESPLSYLRQGYYASPDEFLAGVSSKDDNEEPWDHKKTDGRAYHMYLD